MNCNRVLNVSVILMLSLIFLCVFLFDFYRDLVFLNDDNDFEYYNSVELRASIDNPTLPIDDIRNMYDSFSLLSRVKKNDKTLYYVYDSDYIDSCDIFLKYSSYKEDDYCFLGYDPFNSNQITDVKDRISIKGKEFEIDGLISKVWYNDSVTFYIDYDKWNLLKGADDLCAIDFLSHEKLSDKDISKLNNFFSDYEIVAHHCSKVESVSDKNVSIGYLVVFEVGLPAFVLLFSLSLFVSFFDSHNSRKKAAHIWGRPIVNILFDELMHFMLMALSGVVIGALVLLGLYNLDFVSVFFEKNDIKKTLFNSVVIFLGSIVLFGTIASFKSMNKWRYSK